MSNAGIYYAHERDRHYEKMCPFRAMWLRLTEKAWPVWCEDECNIAILSEEEKVYYSANLLKRNVNNGGFYQYFCVTSSLVDDLVEPSLIRIDDKHSLALYLQAKELLFGVQNLPEKGEKREKIIDDLSKEQDLNELDAKFWGNANTLDMKLRNFAVNNSLLMPAWQ